MSTKTKANSKPESKTKFVFNACERELVGMKSVVIKRRLVQKVHLKTSKTKVTPFLNKFLENYRSFLKYQFVMKSKASNKHSIHL